MYEIYEAHGVRFLYPGFWELSEQPNESGVSITVSSLETSFWSLNIFFDGPDPELVVDQALKAFRDEYDELDVYPADVELCRRQTLARDVDFVCFELLNSAYLRAFRTERFTALVLYQATNDELQQTRPLMNGIDQSLKCESLYDPID